MNEHTKNLWLIQHIQTRMLALQADLKIIRQLQRQLLLNYQLDKHQQLERLFHASWEGRFTAARWLIEFVSMKVDKDGMPLPPDKVRKQKHEFKITDLGGSFMDRYSEESIFLSKLRKDINKASSHPTHESSHGDITDHRLHRAATILKKHLQETLYTPENKILS